jgi:hypothetical protein
MSIPLAQYDSFMEEQFARGVQHTLPSSCGKQGLPLHFAPPTVTSFSAQPKVAQDARSANMPKSQQIEASVGMQAMPKQLTLCASSLNCPPLQSHGSIVEQAALGSQQLA